MVVMLVIMFMIVVMALTKIMSVWVFVTGSGMLALMVW